ncbi:hypothetical protein [Cupriavidus sp. USMAHM13]|uniref:hypothetical protein n=1 Tax=Cupriavidus sp. USMAHM13 TaxID=1389192 RepID=UPI000B281118|nr:hypothetical protein [Cupriavidus sp. USMAHM13]
MLTSISSLGNGELPYSNAPKSSGQTQPASTETAPSLDALLKRNEETRAALSRLSQDASASEKAYARKRLEQLEEMMRRLYMLGFPPKVLAEMAKELKGIVSQYTGAGDQQAPAVSQSEASGFTLSGGASAGGADPSTSGGGLSDTNLTTSQMSVDTSTLGANSHANAYLEIARTTSASSDAVSDADFMARAKALAERLKAMLKQHGTETSSQTIEVPAQT